MNNMKIIEPNVELLEQTEDYVTHVAKCARVCYGKESGNDSILYENLAKNKHLSMFRHETYYAAVPIHKEYNLVYSALYGYKHSPYIKYFTFRDNCYIITNGNFIRDIKEDNPVLYKYIIDYRISPKEAEQIEPIWRNFMRYTFCITTQISTSRELNRVSPNNISEQSTRYVYENGTICRPWWISKKDVEEINKSYYPNNVDLNNIDKQNIYDYYLSCDYSFKIYNKLIKQGNLYRQDARGVLPLDTATKCVYTYSWQEWKEIIKKRVYNTTGKYHPNATIVCKLIEQKLNSLGYDVNV